MRGGFLHLNLHSVQFRASNSQSLTFPSETRLSMSQSQICPRKGLKYPGSQTFMHALFQMKKRGLHTVRITKNQSNPSILPRHHHGEIHQTSHHPHSSPRHPGLAPVPMDRLLPSSRAEWNDQSIQRLHSTPRCHCFASSIPCRFNRFNTATPMGSLVR